MAWAPLTKDEEVLCAAIMRARKISEETGGSTLACAGALAVLETAFRFDRCVQFIECALEYSRRKVKEED